MTPSQGSSRDRGQSEVLGYAVLIALSIAVAAVVVTFGSSALLDARADAGLAQQEGTLQEFDMRASAVSNGDASTETVDLSDEGTGRFAVRPAAGRIEVQRGGTTIFESSLGAVRYETDSVTLSAQSGAIWRTTGNTSVPIERPAVTYRNTTDASATLSLSVRNTTGAGGAAGGGTLVIRGGSAERAFPNTSSSEGNPVDSTINVTVFGSHYDGWARVSRYARNDTRAARRSGVDTAPTVERSTDQRRASFVLDPSQDEIDYLHINEATINVTVD